MKRWRKAPLRTAACVLALTLLMSSLSGCAARPQPEKEQQEKEIAAPVHLSSLRIEKEILPENTKTDEAYMQGNRGFFLPDDTITRAEIAQVYWNLHLSVPGGRTFSDVVPGDWFAQAVAELSGALKGYSDGTFRPQQEATLDEFLTVLCRVLELKPPALEDGAGQPWYAPYLQAAQEAGWLDAHPDAQADAPVTRAVAVSILNRALGREPDREAIDRLDVCVYLDVTPEHPDYYDILEASITHTCDLDRDGAWIEKSLELPNLSAGIHAGGGSAYYVLEDRTLYGEPGLLEVDGARYLVADETGRIYADEALHQYGEELVFSTESGALLCNGSWHDFQFDDQGYYTTGDAELDGYVDLLPVLATCDVPVYYRTDSHWNDYGAALASDAILEALGGAGALAQEPFTASTHLGDLYEMLYPTGAEAETCPVLARERTFSHVSAFRSPEDMTIRTESSGDFGSLLMFRDSFGNNLYAHLAEAFSACCFSRAMPLNLTMLAEEGADTLLFELVERNLSWLISKPPVMEAPIREAVAAEAAGEAAVEVTQSALENLCCYEGSIAALDVDSPIYLSLDGIFYEATPAGTGENPFTLYAPPADTVELFYRLDGIWHSITAA